MSHPSYVVSVPRISLSSASRFLHSASVACNVTRMSSDLVCRNASCSSSMRSISSSLSTRGTCIRSSVVRAAMRGKPGISVTSASTRHKPVHGCRVKTRYDPPAPNYRRGCGAALGAGLVGARVDALCPEVLR